jgi:hypothetical protein
MTANSNMKTLYSILTLLLTVACGSPSPDAVYDTETGLNVVDVVHIYVDEPVKELDGDIGTLEQALTIPTGYGSESDGSGGRCWSGVNCVHPGTKNYARKFYAGTCRSDIQTRFVEAETKLMTQAPWFPVSLGTKNEWRCGSAAKAVELGCEDTAGCAVITISNQTHKVLSADVWIFPENIEGQPGWNNRTIAQQNRYWNNAILHEIYHSLKLDHSDNIHVSELMKDYATESFYTSNLTPTFTERAWLRDYQP